MGIWTWGKKNTKVEINDTAVERQFQMLVRNNRVPILTLDEKWHALFPDYKKTPEIKQLERKVNKLLQSQGKYVNKQKELQKLKKKLMNNIISNMEEESGEEEVLRQRKQDKNQRMIQEINDEIQYSEDLLNQIPDELNYANRELLLESLRVWYRRIHENTRQIDELGAWIKSTKEELKLRIIQKQDMEEENQELYKYMHSMLGPSIMEYLDRRQESSDKE